MPSEHWFLQFRAKASIRLTPPLRRSPSAQSSQAPDRLVPEEVHASGFDDAKLLNDASSMGSLSFVFRMHTCSRSCLELLFQRSPPRLFTAAAWSGLRPAPASRSRGARPHLSRSFTTLSSASCYPPFLVSLQHTAPMKSLLPGHTCQTLFSWFRVQNKWSLVQCLISLSFCQTMRKEY